MGIRSFFNKHLFVPPVEEGEHDYMDIEGNYGGRIDYIHSKTSWNPDYIELQIDTLKSEGMDLNKINDFEVLALLKKREAEGLNASPTEMRIA